jgi:hypothetical protein
VAAPASPVMASARHPIATANNLTTCFLLRSSARPVTRPASQPSASVFVAAFPRSSWNRTRPAGVCAYVGAYARALVLAGVVCGFGGGAFSAAEAPTARAAARTCPVTIPNGSTPPGEHASADNHGNGTLWTGLPLDGRMVVSASLQSPPGTFFGQIHADGSISEKFPWWGARSAGSRLMVAGARLDAHARPLRATVVPGIAHSPHFWATRLTFANSGCWRVTARAGAAKLSFVISVSAAP